MSESNSLFKAKLWRPFGLSIILILVSLLVFQLSIRVVYSAQATLEWEPVVASDLAGYMIYYGTSSEYYDESLDVGNWTSATIGGLLEGQTYYFAATAYNDSGDESDFSNQVSWPESSGYSTSSSDGGG